MCMHPPSEGKSDTMCIEVACLGMLASVPLQVTKIIKKNEEPCRDRIPKKQPNKVETTPQYFYELSSLRLLPFFQPHIHYKTPTCHTHIHISNK